MNSPRFATSQALKAWLQALAAERRFIAPRRQASSVVFGRYLPEEIEDIDPLLERAIISAKEVIFDRSLSLVNFSASKDEINPALLAAKLEAEYPAEPTVLFGGRPCDARGFVVLDRPFLQGPYVDPYYLARRKATLIITQACPSAFPTCFCGWTGSHPTDSEGSDILLTAISGGYALQGISPAGEALLAEAPFPKSAAKQEQVEQAHQAAAATLAPSPDLSEAAAKLAQRFTDEEFWIKETVKCLSCGACTHLCPTCQCYTITDQGSALSGKRLRSWDTCMSYQYTLETSGHNPRAQKFKRMRNRINHKYSYYPQAYAGHFSCTGCGRCVQCCPISLDIRQIVMRAAEISELPPRQAAPVAEVKPKPKRASKAAVAKDGAEPASPKPKAPGKPRTKQSKPKE